MQATDNPPAYRGNNRKPTRELLAWLAQRPIAEAVDPIIPIVDAHHHLFGTPQDPAYYQLADLQRDLDTGHHFLGTVYIEAYESGWHDHGPEALRPVGEVEMIEALTRRPSATKAGDCEVAAAIVAFADLTLGDQVAEVLEAATAAGAGRLRGIRYRTARDESDPILDPPNPPPAHLLLDPAFRRGYARLADFGLTFDAWIYHTQIDELLSLADAHPGVTLIVDHVAGPVGVSTFRDRKSEVMEALLRGLKDLAARPNVVMKIGGMGMPLYGFGFEHGALPAEGASLAPAWQPYIDACVEAFGTGRCMFESNAPVDKQSASYGELWNGFKLATRGWSPDERSDLFYRTACRTYRLPHLEKRGDARMNRTRTVGEVTP
jgi:L-fuconolactonase